MNGKYSGIRPLIQIESAPEIQDPERGYSLTFIAPSLIWKDPERYKGDDWNKQIIVDLMVDKLAAYFGAISDGWV